MSGERTTYHKIAKCIRGSNQQNLTIIGWEMDEIAKGIRGSNQQNLTIIGWEMDER